MICTGNKNWNRMLPWSERTMPIRSAHCQWHKFTSRTKNSKKHIDFEKSKKKNRKMSFFHNDQFDGWNNTVNPGMGFNNFPSRHQHHHHGPEVVEKVEVVEYRNFGGPAREHVEIVKEKVEVEGGRFFQPRQENIEVYKYQNY
ncbi:hypothetical protein Dimus_004683 [Dionaea muscipula]